ncbi:hypothetical protein EG103P1_00100 [Enterococcus phage EG103P1]|nr:hypothetical protein EG103P1_00100 [Enterococcus phage EG103P1]
MLDYSIYIKKYNQSTPTEYQPDLRVDHCNSRLVISEKLLPKLLRAVAEYVREDSILIMKGDVEAYFTQSFTKHASTLNELADRLETLQEADEVEFDLSEARDSRYLLTEKVTFDDCLEATRERMEEQWQTSALEAVQKAADILAKDALDSLLLEKSRDEIPELLEGIQKVSEAAKKSAKDSIELFSNETLGKPQSEVVDDSYWKELQQREAELVERFAEKDLESTAKRFEEAREEHGTPTWRVGALMQESPAKKQRKSLVRAIINLLDTKYK